MDVDLRGGFKMVGVILKTIMLDAIGMEATVVTILILNGKNIVKFRNFANVWTLILQWHHHLVQHLYHQHHQHKHLAPMDVDCQSGQLMKLVTMRTIMLPVTSTMGLVVVTTLTQNIAQIVNVLTQILELIFMKSLLE